MLENALIAHCSPTLARLKLGNLFTVPVVDEDGFSGELTRLNALLMPKGVVLRPLRRRGDRALLYLYREADLQNALMQAEIRAFLKLWGYERFDEESVLAHLCSRLGEGEDFPHEIGVFLGYPLADVMEFIRNEGRNSICSGCWKVYTNECDAIRKFECFRKCKEVYSRLYAAGSTLARLTVGPRKKTINLKGDYHNE